MSHDDQDYCKSTGGPNIFLPERGWSTSSYFWQGGGACVNKLCFQFLLLRPADHSNALFGIGPSGQIGCKLVTETWRRCFTVRPRNLMNTVPCVLQLPEELEKAIGTMTRNEKALIYISRTYCSPASYSLNLNVPPEAEELEFEVELIQLIQVSELNQSSQVCEMAWTSDSGMIHNGWCLLLSMGQVRDMFGDGGLIKRRIRDGTGLPSLVLTHNVMSSTYTQSLETRMNIYWDWTEIAKGKEDNCRPVREFRWLCKTHVVFLQQILGLKSITWYKWN